MARKGTRNRNHVCPQLASRVRRTRRERGLSQECLAMDADIERRQYARFEQGKAALGVDAIARLAGALGMTAAELLEGVELPTAEG